MPENGGNNSGLPDPFDHRPALRQSSASTSSAIRKERAEAVAKDASALGRARLRNQVASPPSARRSPLEQALHSLSDAMVGSHGPAPGHKLRPGGRTDPLRHRARCGAQWPSRQGIPGSGATPGGRGPACENAHGPAPAPSPRGGGSLPPPPERPLRRWPVWPCRRKMR